MSASVAHSAIMRRIRFGFIEMIILFPLPSFRLCQVPSGRVESFRKGSGMLKLFSAGFAGGPSAGLPSFLMACRIPS